MRTLPSLMTLLLATLDGGALAPVPSPALKSAIDRSIVVLPERAGIFVYERSRVGTPEVREGVDADYDVPGKRGDPWIRVMVVPNGRVDETNSVAAQALALQQKMRETQAYVKLQFLPAASITVEAPGRASLYANSRGGATQGWTPPISVGGRQSFIYMDRDGQLTRDAGLVFHRQMADITVRVRVAADDMGQAEFDALADAAARQIVPKLDIRNFGQCPGPVRETNCAPDEASAPDAAPITGVQHVLTYPRVPAPTGCRRDGVALDSCQELNRATHTRRGPEVPGYRVQRELGRGGMAVAGKTR